MVKDILILSIDTSSPKLSIALLNGGILVEEFQDESLNRHSSQIIPRIENLISKNSHSIEDIGLFCIGLGPGSFTGLRVGLATARGLAMVLRKPIIGIPSIDAIAGNVDCQKGRDICVLIDAKQSRVYARLYRSNGNALKPKTRFLLLGIKELFKFLKGPTIFSGDGIQLYKDEIVKKMSSSAEFSHSELWYPKASAIGKLGLAKFKQGRRDNVFTLLPIYIYPKECQVRIVNSPQSTVHSRGV